jgi:two-component system, chemotaxis family, CheB/CheR fusion protein
VTTRSDSGRRSPSDSPESTPADSGTHAIIAILDTIDVPIVVVGPDCTLARINRAATEAFALAPSDIGRRLNTITALADVKDIEKLCGQVIADHAPSRRDVRSGDRRFLLRAAPYAMGTGQLVGAVLTFTNVTAFRASVEQAIYEREYTKAILNTVTNPLVVLDAQLRVQSGNRVFYSTFGISREKAHGMALRDLGDDDWKASGLWAALTALASGSRDFQPFEIDRAFPAVGRRTLLFDARRVTGDGDATTVLLAAQDITELKRSEAELQTANRKKDEFIALLAHELRNPLAPIRTGLELIRLAGDTPESVRRVRPIMERQIGQMVRLIDDLLDISRITSGKIVLQRAPTSLAELIQAAVDAQRAAIETSHIELTIDMPPQAWIVDVDPTRFVQILSNVLHNASKFTPPHGKIRCSAAILPTANPSRVAITISDTGVGIANDLLPHIFEMFTQAASATERQHGGLGIGLALARRLVEMHGGEIAADSGGLGQGSTFTIMMPVCEARLTQAATRPRDVPRVECRVLIIDDNNDAANTMAMLVEELGASTRVAHDATSGLQALDESVPDVVFLDIGMPGIDGYETCRQMRRRASNKTPVIIAVTGWGQPQDKQRALDAGFDAHLTKPVELDALARILTCSPPSEAG